MNKSIILSLLVAAHLAGQEASPKLVIPKMSEPSFGADSMEKAGIPKGKLTDFVFSDSKVFPGTKRRIHLYVPAQYDAKNETALMVFQDGHAYVGSKGDFRATTVFDNLIAAGDMPPVIGIFIDPGHKGDSGPESPWKGRQPQFRIQHAFR